MDWANHDDVIKWKRFTRYWPFVRGILRWPVNSPHKGQWRGALVFTLICAWLNGWVNNREAGDLRRHRFHHDVTVMLFFPHRWICAARRVLLSWEASPAVVRLVQLLNCHLVAVWQMRIPRTFPNALVSCETATQSLPVCSRSVLGVWNMSCVWMVSSPVCLSCLNID